MKIVMVGQGAFGRKHLDGLKNIDGRRGREPRRRQQGIDGGRREAVRHPALRRRISSEALALPGVEAAILTSPTQVHAAQAEQVMRAGKHVEIEIPIADSLADAKRIRRDAEGHGQDRDGRPHAPLQSVAPVGAQAHQEGRAEASAARRADVFLPPQEHQSRGQAAQLDRSLAVAPRVPHRRPVPLPDGRGAVGRARARKGRSIPSSRSRWT